MFRRLTVLVFIAAVPTFAADRFPMLKPCAGNEQARCGTLDVPESRGKKTTRAIAINVMVVPAAGDAAADPLFALTGGGPGIASIAEAASFVKNYAEVAKTRDIVFFDMRGTGESNAIDCDTGGGEAATRAFLAGELPIGNCASAAKRCRSAPTCARTRLRTPPMTWKRFAAGSAATRSTSTARRTRRASRWSTRADIRNACGR